VITSLPDLERRAVVTGLGVIAPNGVGTRAWWSATTRGRSGIREILRFDASRYATRFAGEVVGFEASEHLERRLMVQTDRWTWMGLAAAEMALEDAAFEPGEHDPFAMSVITASSSGGNEFGQVEIQKLWGEGPRFVGAYQSIAWFYAATTGQISIRYGMKGHSGVVAAEGAGGLEALAQARRAVRRGMEAVVSGGLEAPICPYALSCQMANGRMSTAPEATAYRPFDERASGYLPGEGGAILLVESVEAARRRGAPVYGEIAGYGATHDGRLPTERAGDGTHLARAIEMALDDARVAPEEVDVVFADGAAMPDADAAESGALRSALGERASTIPVTVPKTMVGRTYAGGAALDAAAALLSMRDGRIPPTINVERPAEGSGLRLVRGRAVAADVGTALVVARGYGGFNSALVLRRDGLTTR
jgi:3-oxoacyl-(acyl-carrier-protein) synthase